MVTEQSTLPNTNVFSLNVPAVTPTDADEDQKSRIKKLALMVGGGLVGVVLLVLFIYFAFFFDSQTDKSSLKQSTQPKASFPAHAQAFFKQPNMANLAVAKQAFTTWRYFVPTVAALVVSILLIITLVGLVVYKSMSSEVVLSEEDGDGKVEIDSVDSEQSWFEKNLVLTIVVSVVIGLVLIGIFAGFGYYRYKNRVQVIQGQDGGGPNIAGDDQMGGGEEEGDDQMGGGEEEGNGQMGGGPNMAGNGQMAGPNMEGNLQMGGPNMADNGQMGGPVITAAGTKNANLTIEDIKKHLPGLVVAVASELKSKKSIVATGQCSIEAFPGGEPVKIATEDENVVVSNARILKDSKNPFNANIFVVTGTDQSRQSIFTRDCTEHALEWTTVKDVPKSDDEDLVRSCYNLLVEIRQLK